MSEMVEVPATPSIPAQLSRPEGDVKGGVLVIHEVWGLADHIKSVADRFAAEGYTALAPDLMAESGIDVKSVSGLQEALFDPEKRNAIQPELRKVMAPLQNPEFGLKTAERVKACFEYLYKLEETHQQVAVVGFCFGGTYSFTLATQEPRLKLALPFYGHADLSVEELRKITCPVRAFYGAQDERLMEALPELTKRMKEAGIDFSAKVYPNSGHAFFNDTNKFAYNAEAAKDAWKLTLEFLSSYLKG